MPTRNGEYRIGSVAAMTGLTVETIRYYETAGVTTSPRRGENRYRLYSKEQIERLLFVRRCREIGFSLEQTKSLLRLADADNRTCCQVSSVTKRRLDEVRAKIAGLKRVEKALVAFLAGCPKDMSSTCPIIDALSGVS